MLSRPHPTYVSGRIARFPIFNLVPGQTPYPYPAMDKAGVKRNTAGAYGFHLFRHSAGSQMHAVTGDLKQTQGFLGHSGIGITSDVYVHLKPDSEIGSVEKLEESFFGELCSTVLKTGRERQSGLVN